MQPVLLIEPLADPGVLRFEELSSFSDLIESSLNPLLSSSELEKFDTPPLVPLSGLTLAELRAQKRKLYNQFRTLVSGGKVVPANCVCSFGRAFKPEFSARLIAELGYHYLRELGVANPITFRPRQNSSEISGFSPEASCRYEIEGSHKQGFSKLSFLTEAHSKSGNQYFGISISGSLEDKLNSALALLVNSEELLSEAFSGYVPADPKPFEPFLKGLNEVAGYIRVTELRREEQSPSASEYLRLLSAREQFLRALLVALIQGQTRETRLAFYHHIIRGIVDCDAANFENVDPQVGWAKITVQKSIATAEETLILDTQLLRATFSSGNTPGLGSLYYKPRKLNLVCGTKEFDSGENLRLLEASAPAWDPLGHSGIVKHELETLRATPDSAGVRINTREQNSSGGVYRSFIEVWARAGIGAHLPNSTTGLQFDFWLEQQPELPQYLAFTLSLGLATGLKEGWQYSLLLPVGGVLEDTFEPSDPRVHLSQEGCPIHGLRLIDGVAGFVVDLRAARVLHGISVGLCGECEAFRINLLFAASSVIGQEKSNTVFLSIP